MVNVPPFLLTLALLFWGWEADLVPAAIVGAIILELPRWITWRWNFSRIDMHRVWDLCGIIFLGAIIYGYATTDLASGPSRFMPWLPMVFFPFVVAVAYSSHDNVRKSTYFLIFRRKVSDAPDAAPLGQYVPYWYLVVCLGAASIVNARDLRFYAGVAVVGAWLLWLSRNRTTAIWAWALTIVVACVAGFGGQIGLNHLQAIIVNRAGQFMTDLGQSELELNQTRTALGSVGKLKLSGKIVMRLKTDGVHPHPGVVRRASFDRYQSSGNAATWTVSEAIFAHTYIGSEPTTWPLVPEPPGLSSVTISTFLPNGSGILAVPNGPVSLTGLLAGAVETNRCGSVRARETPSLVRYTVKYGDVSTLDGPPTPNDLLVPKDELPGVFQVAKMLGLPGQQPLAAMHRLDEFFAKNFTYSRYLKGIRMDLTGRNTAVRQFLLHDHAGHCEYFATATTLLLRQAGIPARYAIGYAVPDEADGNHVHIIRALHAHAWVLVYVNGSWHNFDTTPGTWEEIEDDQKSFFQPVADFFSGLWYNFTAWRFYGSNTLAKRLLWLVPIAAAWFLWRLFSKRRSVRKSKQISINEPLVTLGKDSEFYQIEQHLAKAGVPRRPGESLNHWLHRVEAARQPNWSIAALRDIITHHYAYRFDPRGLNPDQRRDLKSRVESWLTIATQKAK